MSEQRGSRLGVVYEPESVDVLALSGAVAGRWSLSWIVDYRTSPSERALLARFGTVIDLEHRDGAAAAREVARAGVDGLTAFADGSLLRLSDLGERLGLAVNPRPVALRLVDKLEERRALAAHGLPGPGFRAFTPADGPERVARALADLEPPLVLKPAVGAGGSHVHPALSIAAAVELIERRRAEGDRGTILVETCLGAFPPPTRGGLGDYVSVELVSLDARHRVLAVTGRMPVAPPFRETGAFVPDQLEPAERAEVVATAQAAADALGVQVGCLHVEIKLTAEGPRVIECNGRPGGGGIPQVLRDVGAADPYLCAAAVAMGEEPPVQEPAPDGPIGFAFALQPPLGRLARLRPGWREAVDAMAGVSRLSLRTERGRASAALGAYSYLALVSGRAEDRDALVETYRALNALVEAA